MKDLIWLLNFHFSGEKLCQPSKPPLPRHLLTLCWCGSAGRDGGADYAQRSHQQDHQAPPQVPQGESLLGPVDVRGVRAGPQPHTGSTCHQIISIITTYTTISIPLDDVDMQVFSFGFKSARLFGKNLSVWDFFLKVRSVTSFWCYHILRLSTTSISQ